MREQELEQPSNSWSEYRRLVTSELRQLDIDIKALDNKYERQLKELSDNFHKMQLKFTSDITALQTKAGVWGGVVGAIVAGIIAIAAASFGKGK